MLSVNLICGSELTYKKKDRRVSLFAKVTPVLRFAVKLGVVAHGVSMLIDRTTDLETFEAFFLQVNHDTLSFAHWFPPLSLFSELFVLIQAHSPWLYYLNSIAKILGFVNDS
ncbi:MAG: hypothetical protein NTX82_00395 [Candidatus Parcubacteria bacterium]|nr:hypothetical protein [Candidatus Parcubacteria bacterium]